MSTIRILFVDDSRTDASLAESELTKAGIYTECLTVGDENSLRIALENWDPEVIVAAPAVTGCDGFKALQIARQLTPGVPFVFRAAGNQAQFVARLVRVVNESRATLRFER